MNQNPLTRRTSIASLAAPAPDVPQPMCLRLRQLPASILGIYGPGKNTLPERMRYLDPEAAASYLALEGTHQRLPVSDMWRSADSSLHASLEKRGVQRPAFSGHNFGLSIDLDVRDCMDRWHASKRTLDALMASQGWYCHRKDHVLDSESWHFNFLGVGQVAQRYLAQSSRAPSTAPALEAKIQDMYGADMDLSAVQLQAALRRAHLYTGDLDGILGPLSRRAILSFQRAWDLPATGVADTVTQRTLAFVTAEVEIV